MTSLYVLLDCRGTTVKISRDTASRMKYLRDLSEVLNDITPVFVNLSAEMFNIIVDCIDHGYSAYLHNLRAARYLGVFIKILPEYLDDVTVGDFLELLEYQLETPETAHLAPLYIQKLGSFYNRLYPTIYTCIAALRDDSHPAVLLFREIRKAAAESGNYIKYIQECDISTREQKVLLYAMEDEGLIYADIDVIESWNLTAKHISRSFTYSTLRLVIQYKLFEGEIEGKNAEVRAFVEEIRGRSDYKYIKDVMICNLD
jgi:hypothetical protein